MIKELLNTKCGFYFKEGEKTMTTIRDLHSHPECIRILIATTLLNPHKKLMARLRASYFNVHGFEGNRECKPPPRFRDHGW